MRMNRQIHCFVDCIAHALKEKPDLDTRPLYFGVWDSPFIISDNGVLSYYSHTIGCEDDVAQVHSLYSLQVNSWYDYAESRVNNYARLRAEADKLEGNREVLLLVNLFYLPYPNGCHLVSHRPHFVLINRRMDGEWQLRDPYFSWEGAISDQVMSRAFLRKENFAGYSFDRSSVRQPHFLDVGSALKKRLDRSSNPLTSAVRELVKQARDGNSGASFKQLSVSLGQLGVIAKRKQSYALAFEYFSEMLCYDPKDAIGRVDRFVKAWINLAFLVIRLSISGRPEEASNVLEKLDMLDEEETQLKEELWVLYERWSQSHVQ
jgi:petrobactin synthase